jgi:4,5-dihydroxyphthalate decarboxylase
MSKQLELSFAAGDYELVRPLADGRVRPDGIELIVLNDSGARERHWRMARNNEYDICEFNIYAYLIARDQGMPMAGLPVFLHRRFRHGFAFVNTEKGIKEPKDLIGRRIGTTNFQPAGNMWIRGVLEEDYGVPHRSITWVTERDEDIDFEIPSDLKIERLPEGVTVDQALLAGDLDALLAPNFPPPFLRGDKRIARLFPNHKDVELDYYRKTGLFPIMHVTVIRQDILDRHPWVATSLVEAFRAAKQLAYRRVQNPRIVPLAWFGAAWEEQRAVLGSDPWEFGLTPANRKNLETINRYALMQGVIRRELPIEELYVDAGENLISSGSF